MFIGHQEEAVHNEEFVSAWAGGGGLGGLGVEVGVVNYERYHNFDSASDIF